VTDSLKGGIPQIDGVKPVVSKGKTYLYHRATGERIRAAYGTPEFTRELDALDAKAGLPKRPSLGGTTLGDLIDAYRDSPKFSDLDPRTQIDYQHKFDYLRPISMMPLIDLNRAELVRIRDKAHKAKKFHFANYLISVLRLTLTWGVERGWVPFNPAKDIEKIERPKHLGEFPHKSWTEGEKVAVLEAAKGGVRIAIGLGMFAAMRQGDALSVTWGDIHGERLLWKQRKTKGMAGWPVVDGLAMILDEARDMVPGGNPLPSRVIVLNERRQPYTGNGFRVLFFRLLKRLERDGTIRQGLTFHGLRHTAGKELVENGGTTAEVQSRLGHKTLAMAELYSKEFNRTKLEDSAARKLRPQEPAEVVKFPGKRKPK
jgi:integrase